VRTAARPAERAASEGNGACTLISSTCGRLPVNAARVATNCTAALLGALPSTGMRIRIVGIFDRFDELMARPRVAMGEHYFARHAAA
jgi:hypothetical protein